MIKSYNGNSYFRLCVKCPGDCGDKSVFWLHTSCKTSSFIDIEGFIFCQKHIDSYCSRYFIKDCGFKCDSEKHGNEYKSFKQFSDFLIALGQAIKSIENTSDYNDQVEEFIDKMSDNLRKNWRKL